MSSPDSKSSKSWTTVTVASTLITITSPLGIVSSASSPDEGTSPDTSPDTSPELSPDEGILSSVGCSITII